MRVPAENKTREQLALGGVFSASLLISAYLMSRSMAGVAAPWVGWISLAPLLLTIRCLTPFWAAAAGALWGTALVVSSALSATSAFPVTFTSTSLLVSVPALYTLAGALLTRSRVGFSPLILGAAWVGVEYALAPLALRYGLLSGGVSDIGILQAAGGVLGYGFIAFVVAYANGLLLGLLAKVRIKVPGPLFVPGAVDPGARILPEVVPCLPFRGARAARPRAPPIR